jgi:membrane protein YdbS with pleckstrin-like domain
MAVTDLIELEERLKQRYLKASKIFLLLTIIYSLWVIIIIIGVYSLGLNFKWATFTIGQWISSAIALISILIGFELLFILHYLYLKRKKAKPEPSKQPVYIQGKQLYHYTLPIGAKGGIFSKTFILIDENRVLHLRYQMIPPNELWGKQQ